MTDRSLFQTLKLDLDPHSFKNLAPRLKAKCEETRFCRRLPVYASMYRPATENSGNKEEWIDNVTGTKAVSSGKVAIMSVVRCGRTCFKKKIKMKCNGLSSVKQTSRKLQKQQYIYIATKLF